MKLKTRMQLFSTALLFVLLITTNGAIYFIFYQTTMNGEMERLKRQAEQIMTALNDERAAKIDPENLIRSYRPADGMIRIVDTQSTVKMADAADATFRAIDAQYKTGQSSELITIAGTRYAAVSIPMIWRDGSVVGLELVRGIDAVEQNLDLLKIVLAVTSLLILLPAFFAAGMLGKVILKPIHAMIHTMEKIQQSGHYQKISLAKRSNDELYKMAATFNQMMDMLRQHDEKQQQFVSDASHELKTPLTVIESYAELLKRWGKKREDILDESIEAIHSEARRMKHLTRQMLLLADGEETWTLTLQSTDLVALCSETGRQFERVYGREVHVHALQSRLPVRIDPHKIRQLLVILLDNAIKYSQSAVTIRSGLQESRPFLAVEDQGIGIPEKDVRSVFDRFFRVDKVRSRKTGGSGLGLSIARRIVSAHQGDIQLQSIEGAGTIVTVLLPDSSRVVDS